MGNERFMFWFWESPTRSRHACKVKKHLHCLIIAFNLTLLAQRLNNLFEDSFFQIKFFVMLNCSDWSHLHLIWPVKPDKAVFVNSVTGKPVFYPPKESELAFSFRPTRKDQHQYANVSCWHEAAWDSSVSMIQSRLFLLRDSIFIRGALSDLTLFRMFSFA